VQIALVGQTEKCDELHYAAACVSLLQPEELRRKTCFVVNQGGAVKLKSRLQGVVTLKRQVLSAPPYATLTPGSSSQPKMHSSSSACDRRQSFMMIMRPDAPPIQRRGKACMNMAIFVASNAHVLPCLDRFSGADRKASTEVFSLPASLSRPDIRAHPKYTRFMALPPVHCTDVISQVHFWPQLVAKSEPIFKASIPHSGHN